MTADLDALRQQYLQCLNALALELPIAVHTDATGIISVYVRALLARLDAQQQELSEHENSRITLRRERIALQQRLDAVTALEQKWREMDPQPKDDTYIDGINEGRRECLRELAAVLTGEAPKIGESMGHSGNLIVTGEARPANKVPAREMDFRDDD